MRLGMLASKQLNGSLRAMSDFQENRIEMLIDRDRELDELEAEINELRKKRDITRAANDESEKKLNKKQNNNRN